MADRKLVVYEADPAEPEKWRLIALDPNRATGIPLPAFRPVTVLPAAGVQVGEGVLNTTNHQSFIWDGLQWVNIVPPSILSYNTEADLIADLAPAIGTHAFALDTGNLFVLLDGTPHYWRQIGMRVFATEAELLAANAMDGEQAFAMDTQKAFRRINGAWMHASVEFMTQAQARGETAAPGRVIFSTDTGDVYFSSGTNWHTVAADTYHRSLTYSKAEVDQLLSSLTLGLAHDIAVESILTGPLPTTPAEGDAYIIDVTNNTPALNAHRTQVAIFEGGAWRYRTPVTNETHLVEDVSQLWHWNGRTWVLIATGSLASNMPKGDFFQVGSVQQSMLSELQFSNSMPVTERDKWVLADGRAVIGTKYSAVKGEAHVPDLRGAYLRMAGTNGNGARAGWIGGLLGTFHNWTTGRSKRAMTGTTNWAGNHSHQVNPAWGYAPGSGGSSNIGAGDSSRGHIRTDTQGNHQHTLSINGGGDSETRPNTFTVNFFIKVN